ncbi:MAG: hypothetical protein GXN91_05300, partial [Epsilonproteobacteria bacterium]|nr:hypothetical protein [Campylobacterota bacterium]
YDYLFVDCKVESNKEEQFLKKCHSTIKNGGLIIIFTPNESSTIERLTQLLEENYYVATNFIEIDSNSGVLISRKMHGWGG